MKGFIGFYVCFLVFEVVLLGLRVSSVIGFEKLVLLIS